MGKRDTCIRQMFFLLGMEVGKRLQKYYSGTSLLWTSLKQLKMSLLVRCPRFRGSFVLYLAGTIDSVLGSTILCTTVYSSP